MGSRSKGSNLTPLHWKLGGSANKKATTVKVNLPTVLESGRKNNEYEVKIAELQSLLEEKEHEVEMFKYLCLQLQKDIKVLTGQVQHLTGRVQDFEGLAEDVVEVKAASLRLDERFSSLRILMPPKNALEEYASGEPSSSQHDPDDYFLREDINPCLTSPTFLRLEFFYSR